MDEWLFDMDNDEDVGRLVPTVLAMLKNPDESKRKVMAAKERVAGYQKATMNTLGGFLKS